MCYDSFGGLQDARTEQEILAGVLLKESQNLHLWVVLLLFSDFSQWYRLSSTEVGSIYIQPGDFYTSHSIWCLENARTENAQCQNGKFYLGVFFSHFCRIPPSSRLGKWLFFTYLILSWDSLSFSHFRTLFKAFVKMTNCCQFWRVCLSFPQLCTLLAWLLTLLDPFFPKKRGGLYPLIGPDCRASVGPGSCRPWRAFGPCPPLEEGAHWCCGFQSFFRLPPFFKAEKNDHFFLFW